MLINLKEFINSNNLRYDIDNIFVLTDENFVNEIKLNKEIHIVGSIFKLAENLFLNSIITYSYTETCARCLNEFSNQIEAQLNINIVNNTVEDDENIYVLLKDNKINLEEPIKQVIYLSKPIRALCEEECKGICASCGVDLNNNTCRCDNSTIDPRLEGLKKLLDD